MGWSGYAHHLHGLYAILRRVPVKVVVEDSESLLRVLLNLFDLRGPFLKLLLCVPVIVPWSLPVAVPPDVAYR